MQTRYRKTAAGQAEVRAKSLHLSRPVRNLLLSINASQPAAFWLSQLQGVNPADLNMLRDAGLIEAVDSHAAAAAAPEAARVVAPAFEATIPVERESSPDTRGPASASTPPATSDALWVELLEDVKRSSYESLSEVLNAQAKAHLGLVRGYRFTLELEKCNGVSEMQAFGARFAERLREEYGMTAVRRFHAAMRAKL